MLNISLRTVVICLLFASPASSQHCCTDVDFEPVSVTDLDKADVCSLQAEQIHNGIDGIAFLAGANLIKGSDGLFSVDVEGFGCIHDLELGSNLVLSERFSPEVNKWLITVSDRDSSIVRDSLTLGKDFLQINRK